MTLKLAIVSLHQSSSPPYQSYFLPIPSIQPDYLWPPGSAGPVGEPGRHLFEYWSKPDNAARLSQMKFIPAHSWPPPPLILGIIGFPVIRVFYHKFYSYLYLKCMGTPLPTPCRERGFFNDGRFMIRIRAGGEPEQNPNGDVQQRLQQWKDRQDDQQQQQQVSVAAADEDPNAAAAEVAEQLIDVDAASLGRRIGGALIIPSVSSFMGNLLFRLSKHSGILRSFLGIRPRKASWTDYMLPPWGPSGPTGNTF